MKRIGLNLTLFFIAFVFTQCNPAGCGWGGEESIIEPSPSGLSIINSQFWGDSVHPYIKVQLEYLFVTNKRHVSLINSAYACSPKYVPGNYSINRLVDSISVQSTPTYNLFSIDKQLSVFGSGLEDILLSSFNSHENRGGYSDENNTLEYSLLEKPTQSDSFTFSFYYYKDGAIIDSSFTQKFFISD